MHMVLRFCAVIALIFVVCLDFRPVHGLQSLRFREPPHLRHLKKVRYGTWSSEKSVQFSSNNFHGQLVKVALKSRCSDYAEYLRTQPRWGGKIIGPIVRYINTCCVATMFFFILRIWNKFKCIRRNVLERLIFHRPKNVGLLTVSNHQSVMDDPGLWSAFLPLWRARPEQVRWVLCTEDVFFAVRSPCRCMMLRRAELLASFSPSFDGDIHDDVVSVFASASASVAFFRKSGCRASSPLATSCLWTDRVPSSSRSSADSRRSSRADRGATYSQRAVSGRTGASIRPLSRSWAPSNTASAS